MREVAGVAGPGPRSSHQPGGHHPAGIKPGRRGYQDDPPVLPLESDVSAPHMDHRLSRPTLHDINYILQRWGARWSQDRKDLMAGTAQVGPRTHADWKQLLTLTERTGALMLNEYSVFGVTAFIILLRLQGCTCTNW